MRKKESFLMVSSILISIAFITKILTGCAGESSPNTTNCISPNQVCNGVCTDVRSDANNCGSCGHACQSGQTCLNGVCQGLVNCGGELVDIRYNPRHCGGCGHACATGQTCDNGNCTGGSCPAGQTDCPGVGCVDLRSNPDNCGTCGHSCGGNACYDGACVTDCPQGQQKCSGVCTDVQKDSENCGSCGKVCNQGEVCENGNCVLHCPEGLQNCNGQCVNLSSDHNNCGSCGHACGASEVCNSGSCSSSGCVSPLIECDGACVDPRTDEQHCGNCTTRCNPGESCTDGRCGIVCPSGQTLCSGRCVDTQTDEANCGRCAATCRSDQVCLSGSCRCPEPGTQFMECGGVCVDVLINPQHCGRCNNPCTGSEVCDNGTCSLNCPSGYTPCGGYCVDTTSDRNNCGGCGITCSSSESCVGGSCTTSAVCPADTCATAIDVTGGGRFTGSTTCAGGDYSGTCGGASGREIVFKFTTTSTQDVFMSTHGSSFDTVLYVRSGTCGSGTDIYCNDDEHGLQSELNLVDLPAGTYYVFLDGYFSSSYGDYVFDIYMTDPSFEGDRCGDPQYFDVSSATTLSDNTCPWYWFDANPDTVGCSGTTDGKDRVYYFIVDTPTTLTFDTCTGTSWDTILYVRSVCNQSGGGVVCNDDSCSLQSSITYTFQPGIYYLWVDGYSSSACGGYTVTITR